MRDKIIEILNEENRKMNPIEILGRIKSKERIDE